MPKLEAGHRRTSAAQEDYLKALFRISGGAQTVVPNARLAEEMGVSPGSVSEMLGKLAALGFIVHDPYHGARLTPEGIKVAIEMTRHHRLIETYLVRAGEWYNIWVMCWKNGQRSPVHDHAASTCAVRVLRGTLTETRFELAPNGAIKAVIKNTQTTLGRATQLDFALKPSSVSQVGPIGKRGKHMVWVPARTGSHVGGSWVEVDVNGKPADDSPVETATGEQLRRQQLSQPIWSIKGQGGGIPPTP